MKKLAAVVLLMTLAGCGTAPNNLSFLNAPSQGPARAFDDATIVNLPGIPVNAPLSVTGTYQGHNLTGNATISALDAQHMTVSATLTAHVLFITETKQVTFSLTSVPGNAQWPILADVDNVTDKDNHQHKAAVVTKTANSMTYKLDDGTQALISADGRGHGQIVYGDFNLTIGVPQGLRFLPSPIRNHPTSEHFFGR
jgi:hypothetical protein